VPKYTFAKTVMNFVYVPACNFWSKLEGMLNLKGEMLHTGMRYKITFFKLSKTRRPNSIATGIEEKSVFNKMIEADLRFE
jgi:hypothetical protein